MLGGIQGGVTSYPGATTVLSVFVRAFRTPDLRQKLLFSGAMIALFRLGANLPAPGISEQNVRYCSGAASSNGVFAILNLLSGNSLRQLTVFAIGILPYITVSITAVIMWTGELITDRGVGNGMSVLMFTSIMAVIPGEIGEIYEVKGFFYAAAAVLVIVAVTTLIVFIEQGSAASQSSTRSGSSAGGCTTGVHVHPGEGEPGRRGAGYLRFLTAGNAAASPASPDSPKPDCKHDIGQIQHSG